MNIQAKRTEKMWCTVCGARFTEEEIKGWGCPKCGNQGVPCGVDGDVKVEINWHELHILTCWAEQWAERVKAEEGEKNGAGKVVTAIARRLSQQHPELPSLTLAGEIAGLPVKLQEMGMGITGVSTNIPRPTPIPVNGPGAIGHGREPAAWKP